MVDLFVREIREGIGETGVRAGILKCASDRPGITPGVERVLRAVAQAHRATGVPITTHTPTPPEPWGLEQQRIFAEEGVDLTRVVIGHAGGTRQHRLPPGSDRQRLVPRLRPLRPARHHPRRARRAVARPVPAGPTPTASCSPTMPCASSTGSRAPSPTLSGAGGGPTSPTRCSRSCCARGISESDITTMLVDNPRSHPRRRRPVLMAPRGRAVTLLQPELVAQWPPAYPDGGGLAEPGRRQRADLARLAPPVQPAGPGARRRGGSYRGTAWAR